MKGLNGKKIACVLAAVAFVGCFGGCFRKQAESSQSEETEQSMTLYKNAKIVSLNAGQTTEIAIDADVGNKNYLKMDLFTDVNLVGYIHYANSANTSKQHAEKFFVESGAEDFNTFLDAFRTGAFGAYEKKIEKITLQNVSEAAGNVKIATVSISDRAYDNQEMLYVDNGYIKAGAWLGAGGALCHVEKLNSGVVEYIDAEGKVRIEENVDASKVNTITNQVNLVNIHDLGREIQQSYYCEVNEEHGYAPDDEVLYEGSLLYNPVQAGSAGDKQTQVIDYRVTDGEIWVKVKPQDWFLDNTQSDSYMENRYYFHESGMLMVENRFVNFSQFKDVEKTRMVNQEIPAIYVVHPLNYYYCETTEGVINDPNLSPMPGNYHRTGLEDVVAEGTPYCYALTKDKVRGNWFAFLNDKGFGMGFYLPNTDRFNASRGWTSTWYDTSFNSTFSDVIYQLDNRKKIPSAYVPNYNYASTGITRRMEDFVPLEYTYVVDVGNVNTMKTRFEQMQAKQLIKNEGLNAWAKPIY